MNLRAEVYYSPTSLDVKEVPMHVAELISHFMQRMHTSVDTQMIIDPLDITNPNCKTM